ncbi:hypothetical protein TKK_0013505 [Trichogramma kaykai]
MVIVRLRLLFQEGFTLSCKHEDSMKTLVRPAKSTFTVEHLAGDKRWLSFGFFFFFKKASTLSGKHQNSMKTLSFTLSCKHQERMKTLVRPAKSTFTVEHLAGDKRWLSFGFFFFFKKASTLRCKHQERMKTLALTLSFKHQKRMKTLVRPAKKHFHFFALSWRQPMVIVRLRLLFQEGFTLSCKHEDSMKTLVRPAKSTFTVEHLAGDKRWLSFGFFFFFKKASTLSGKHQNSMKTLHLAGGKRWLSFGFVFFFKKASTLSGKHQDSMKTLVGLAEKPFDFYALSNKQTIIIVLLHRFFFEKALMLSCKHQDRMKTLVRPAKKHFHFSALSCRQTMVIVRLRLLFQEGFDIERQASGQHEDTSGDKRWLSFGFFFFFKKASTLRCKHQERMKTLVRPAKKHFHFFALSWRQPMVIVRLRLLFQEGFTLSCKHEDSMKTLVRPAKSTFTVEHLAGDKRWLSFGFFFFFKKASTLSGKHQNSMKTLHLAGGKRWLSFGFVFFFKKASTLSGKHQDSMKTHVRPAKKPFHFSALSWRQTMVIVRLSLLFQEGFDIERQASGQHEDTCFTLSCKHEDSMKTLVRPAKSTFTVEHLAGDKRWLSFGFFFFFKKASTLSGKHQDSMKTLHLAGGKRWLSFGFVFFFKKASTLSGKHQDSMKTLVGPAEKPFDFYALSRKQTIIIVLLHRFFFEKALMLSCKHQDRMKTLHLAGGKRWLSFGFVFFFKKASTLSGKHQDSMKTLVGPAEKPFDFYALSRKQTIIIVLLHRFFFEKALMLSCKHQDRMKTLHLAGGKRWLWFGFFFFFKKASTLRCKHQDSMKTHVRPAKKHFHFSALGWRQTMVIVRLRLLFQEGFDIEVQASGQHEDNCRTSKKTLSPLST